MKADHPRKPLVWVDIGGGTGFNIEEMDRYFPVAGFDAVYLIDLCQPCVLSPSLSPSLPSLPSSFPFLLLEHHARVLCDDRV